MGAIHAISLRQAGSQAFGSRVDAGAGKRFLAYFGTVMENLNRGGCSKDVLWAIEQYRKQVIQRAAELSSIGLFMYPFLPVIPDSLESLSRQLAWIPKNRECEENSPVHPRYNLIRNTIAVPEGIIYFIFGISIKPGQRSVREAAHSLQKANRSPLVGAELPSVGLHMAHCIKERAVAAAGSSYVDASGHCPVLSRGNGTATVAPYSMETEGSCIVLSCVERRSFVV